MNLLKTIYSTPNLGKVLVLFLVLLSIGLTAGIRYSPEEHLAEEEPPRKKDEVHFKLKAPDREKKLFTAKERREDRAERLQRVIKRHKSRLIVESIRNLRREGKRRKDYGVQKFKAPVVRSYHAKLRSGRNLEATIKALENDPDIEWAGAVHKVQPLAAPNDPCYPYFSCGLSGQFNYLDSINIEAAWDISTGSHDVVVGVLDSAGNYYHEDLMNNRWVNPGEVLDGSDNDGNGYADDLWGYDFYGTGGVPRGIIPESDFTYWHSLGVLEYEHGSMVSGIIGAQGNNSIGITGVNWEISLMFLNALWGGVDDLTEALYYACDNGAHIINMSLAPGSALILKEAVDYCYGKGVLMVASAGNSASTRRVYPAGYDHVLSVGSARTFGKLSDFSHYGIWLDIVAPGDDIIGTAIEGYDQEYGTSFSAPVVSGVAALIKSSNMSLSHDQLARHLYSSAKSVKAVEPSRYPGMGAGYLQADLNIDPDNIPTKMEVVSLAYENQNSASDTSFYRGDTVLIRPTVRNFNFSGVIEDVTLTLSLTGGTGLTVEDAVIHLPAVGPDRRVTSWSDTFRVKVNSSLTQYNYDQEFTITIRDGMGKQYSGESFTMTVNPLLGNLSQISPAVTNTSNTKYNAYKDVEFVEDNAGRIHVVFASSFLFPLNGVYEQLYHRVREADGSWGPLITIPNPDHREQRNHALAVGSDGKLHIAYVQYAGDDGIYYNTYDLAGGWGTAVRIGGDDTANGFSSSLSFLKIVLDASNNPTVYRSAWAGGSGAIYSIKNNGTSWLSPEHVVDFTGSIDLYSIQFSLYEDDNGYPVIIFLEYNDGVYYTRNTGAGWEVATKVCDDHFFSAATDSSNTIHLVSWNRDVNFDELNYRTFSGNAWHIGPQPVNSSGYDRNKMKMVVYSDQPQVYFTNSNSLAVQKRGLNRSVLTAGLWNSYTNIYSEDDPRYGVDDFFKASDIMITASGEILYGFPFEFIAPFAPNNVFIPILVLTSDESKKSLLPPRPEVSLDINQSTMEVNASYNNIDSEIASYFFTFGTAPGQDDMGAVWQGASFRDAAAYAPVNYNWEDEWLDNQAFYATVKAIGKNGYVSTGSSHTPVTLVDFAADRDVIAPGMDVTLSWITMDADTVSISPDIGAVAGTGSITITPAESTIYTLSVTGAGTSVPLTKEITIYVATDLVADGVKTGSPEPQLNEYFGSEIVMDGETMLVGSPFYDSSDHNRGAVHVYERNLSGSWVFKQTIEASGGNTYDHFGGSIAISGNTMVIGATGSEVSDQRRSGAAYIFEYNTGRGLWQQKARLTMPTPQENQGFGTSVAIDGDTVVVASGRGETNGVASSGSVHIFSKPAGGWSDTNSGFQLTDVDDLEGNDRFGSDVSVSGNTILVGAAYSDYNNSGSAYIFELSGGSWVRKAVLIAPDWNEDDRDHFGNHVIIKDDIAIIGSFRDNNGQGSVFVFEKGMGWNSTTVSKLEPPYSENNNFGIDFDFNGTTIVVGQSNYSSNTGYAYLFRKNGTGVWEQTSELAASGGITWSDNFGSGVAIGSSGVAVGARFKDDFLENSGSIYNYDWLY